MTLQNKRFRFSPSMLFDYCILLLGAGIMILPFFWMVCTSFKTFQETFKLPIAWLPETLSFANYQTVLEKMNFALFYKNTILVAVCITVGQIILASLAAYAFARMHFPGRDILFFCLLTVFMVPGQMTLIPKFLLVKNLGWLDTFAALIVPGLFSVYSTFFLRQYFKTLPNELEDSAKIDGCSYLRTFWSIMLPLCKNAIIALSIFSVLGAWNDLVWPLIVTTGESKRVLSVAMATLQGQYSTKNNLLMAASVLSTAPMMVLFAIGQKQIISGIAVSGIKG